MSKAMRGKVRVGSGRIVSMDVDISIEDGSFSGMVDELEINTEGSDLSATTGKPPLDGDK